MKKNRASMTAVKVGRMLLYLAHHPRLSRCLPAGLAEANERLMLAGGLAKPWMIKTYERQTWLRVVDWLERHTLQGVTLEYGVRKAFIDAETRDAIAAGAQQVLVVGAGFDTLCLRLSEEYPDVTFVEVDHPATATRKREALAAMKVARDNLHLLAEDLGERKLADVLDELEAWDARAPSVIVAEAVLMYLDEAAVTGFLDVARAHTAAGSKLLFTYLRYGEDGDFYFGESSKLLQMSLKMVGEPLKWGVHPDELEGFLHEHGFALVTDPARNDLRARFLTPNDLGEDVALADAERCVVATSLPATAAARAS
jgi:methyltransferase (TIGR00027 family)